ncbi:MAG: hypothetical protein U9R44_07450 [Candidatus Omnitrophota bacterium]|nr:hypothetical protein [Candidatus Omnitrophota bacterium]
MDPKTIIVQTESTISPALIAGTLTMIGALLGIFLSNYYDRRKRREASEHKVKHIVNAIYTEFIVLWGEVDQGIGVAINKRKKGKILNFGMFFEEYNFILYESNGSLLGTIKDDELRSCFVKMYYAFKEVLGLVNRNQKKVENLIKVWDEMTKHREKTAFLGMVDPAYEAMTASEKIQKEDAVYFASTVKDGYERLKHIKDDLEQAYKEWEKNNGNTKKT